MGEVIPQFKPFMSPEVEGYIMPVLHSGYIGQGPKVEEFELELKRILDFDYAVTVNSGTSALTLALILAGAGPGTNVVSTAMTCSATNEAIAATGAEIIWADVDGYGNINPYDVIKKANSQTIAIMTVDWAGMPCDYDALRDVLDSSFVTRPVIIEDAAHAFMATYENESIAKRGGDYVAYSFQAIKHLTTGDGGLLVVPEHQYERAKRLRWFGLDRTSSDAMRCRQDISEIGYKMHMNDINASIGLANLKYIDTIMDAYKDISYKYDVAFSGMQIKLPNPKNRESAHWLYPIHVQNPIGFEKWMKDKGIGVSQTHHRNDQYSVFKNYRTTLPDLDRYFATMCCIPIGWWLSEDDTDYIIDRVKEYVYD